MLALLIYLIALFFLGVGNAVITYHILRYRDPGDLSGTVLAVYYGFVIAILVSTALLVDWSVVFGLAAPSLFF